MVKLLSTHISHAFCILTGLCLVALPVVAEPSENTMAAMEARSDANRDDWQTEVLSQQAELQLKVLSKLITDSSKLDSDHLAQLIDQQFVCSRLRPSDLTIVFTDPRVTIRRPSATPTPADNAHHGASGLADMIKEMVTALGPGHDIRCKLKPVGIERSEEFFATQVLVELSNRSNTGIVQQSGRWLCRWRYADVSSSDKPRLNSIHLLDYEEVTISTDSPLFTDCTVSAMQHCDSYKTQMLLGINHWLPRISSEISMNIFGHVGVAIGDVNGDGLDDLYVCETGGLPNRLYVQQHDGTLRDVSARARVDWLEHTSSALFVDLDNDGDQDLALLIEQTLLLVSENQGDATFKVTFKQRVGGANSISGADYDLDGDLDLYVTGYIPEDESDQDRSDAILAGLPAPIPYHDANNGAPNMMMRNDGDFQFSDITEKVGLSANNTRFSFAATWEDYDNDGDPDLYVANDFGRNNLYRNDAGNFVDVAAEAGVEDHAAGMSAAWGDYNRDGTMDIYIGNMFSGAGNRVTYQRRFTEDRKEETVGQLRRMARGNTLFANAADGTFQDVSEQAAVTMGRWAWGSKFIDINNDGWLDILVANGYISADDTGDL